MRQYLQRKGRAPVWIFICISSLFAVENPFLHVWHWWGCKWFAVCFDLMCFFKVPADSMFPQNEQGVFLWVFIWTIKEYLFLQTTPQLSHFTSSTSWTPLKWYWRFPLSEKSNKIIMKHFNLWIAKLSEQTIFRNYCKK